MCGYHINPLLLNYLQCSLLLGSLINARQHLPADSHPKALGEYCVVVSDGMTLGSEGGGTDGKMEGKVWRLGSFVSSWGVHGSKMGVGLHLVGVV